MFADRRAGLGTEAVLKNFGSFGTLKIRAPKGINFDGFPKLLRPSTCSASVIGIAGDAKLVGGVVQGIIGTSAVEVDSELTAALTGHIDIDAPPNSASMASELLHGFVSDGSVGFVRHLLAPNICLRHVIAVPRDQIQITAIGSGAVAMTNLLGTSLKERWESIGAEAAEKGSSVLISFLEDLFEHVAAEDKSVSASSVRALVREDGTWDCDAAGPALVTS